MKCSYIKYIADFKLLQGTSTEGYIDELSFGNTLFIITIFFILWFLSGLLFALWVRKDLRRRGKEIYFFMIIVILTSFIGFILYELFKSGEECELDLQQPICASAVDEVIIEEEEEEFEDEVEEVIEEDIEDLIDEELKEESSEDKIKNN